MKNKGITLIALVITIIILLILAAVTITTLTGENGIIAKAMEAREKTEIGGIKEQIQIAILGSYDQDGKLNLDKLKTELGKIQKNITITDNNKGFPVTITINKHTFEINSKGNIAIDDEDQGKEETQKPSEGIGTTAKDIVNSNNKSEYYGAIVTGYNCENSAGVNAWKIFYADENNIYLIADDYIEFTYAPKGKGGTALKKGDTDYKLDFEDVMSDYSGSSDITDEKIQALNDSYFNYLIENNTTSGNKYMKAVAYMLDTDVWSGFAGNKAEYAIGGPTIEMLIKSYNQKYNLDYQTKAKNNMGYEISVDGGTYWNPGRSKLLDTTDDLYVISSSQKAEGMWIASPCAPNSMFPTAEYMYIDSYDGTVNGIMGGNFYGFRPLICLSSNVRLEKSSNGTYAIK